MTKRSKGKKTGAKKTAKTAKTGEKRRKLEEEESPAQTFAQQMAEVRRQRALQLQAQRDEEEIEEAQREEEIRQELEKELLEKAAAKRRRQRERILQYLPETAMGGRLREVWQRCGSRQCTDTRALSVRDLLWLPMERIVEVGGCCYDIVPLMNWLQMQPSWVDPRTGDALTEEEMEEIFRVISTIGNIGCENLGAIKRVHIETNQEERPIVEVHQSLYEKYLQHIGQGKIILQVMNDNGELVFGDLGLHGDAEQSKIKMPIHLVEMLDIEDGDHVTLQVCRLPVIGNMKLRSHIKPRNDVDAQLLQEVLIQHIARMYVALQVGDVIYVPGDFLGLPDDIPYVVESLGSTAPAQKIQAGMFPLTQEGIDTEVMFEYPQIRDIPEGTTVGGVEDAEVIDLPEDWWTTEIGEEYRRMIDENLI